MFLYENLFFSISSVISIPVMLIGINGGYFPAICRVCLIAALIFSAGYYSAPFYDSKRSIGEVLLINFIGVIFEAGNETREKNLSDFGAEQKLRAERKESGFCSYRCL